MPSISIGENSLKMAYTYQKILSVATSEGRNMRQGHCGTVVS